MTSVSALESNRYRILTWNVNGLRTRFTDLHSYVISKNPMLLPFKRSDLKSLRCEVMYLIL